MYNAAHHNTVTPSLSVIIPVYNRASLVGRLLECIRTQELWPDELILVDNNSTDGSYDVLCRWRDSLPDELKMRVKVTSEKRQGAARARHTGVDMATGDYIHALDSDDTIQPGYFARIYDVVKSNGEPDLCVWPITRHELCGRIKVRPLIMGKPFDNNILHALLSTQGYAVKREFLQRCGNWRTDLHGWDDIELGHRILLEGPRIAWDRRSLYDCWEQGEMSITGADYTHREGEWEHVIDLMEEATLESNHPETVHIMRLLAYKRSNLAALYRREGNYKAARREQSKALKSPWLTVLQRLYLRFSYRLTAAGIPGAARPVPYIF